MSSNLNSKRTASQQPEFNVDQKFQSAQKVSEEVLNPEVEVNENIFVEE